MFYIFQVILTSIVCIDNCKNAIKLHPFVVNHVVTILIIKKLFW